MFLVIIKKNDIFSHINQYDALELYDVISFNSRNDTNYDKLVK